MREAKVTVELTIKGFLLPSQPEDYEALLDKMYEMLSANPFRLNGLVIHIHDLTRKVER